MLSSFVRIAAAFCVLLTVSSTAEAKVDPYVSPDPVHFLTLNVASEKIRLPVPNDICLFNEKRITDSTILAAARDVYTGDEKVLAGFAPCTDLESVRSGRKNKFDVFGLAMWIYPNERINAKLPISKALQRIENDFLDYNRYQQTFVTGTATNGGLLRPNTDVMTPVSMKVAFRTRQTLGLKIVQEKIEFGVPVRQTQILGFTRVLGIPFSIQMTMQGDDPEMQATVMESLQRLLRSVLYDNRTEELFPRRESYVFVPYKRGL